jgi:hypothetical protein
MEKKVCKKCKKEKLISDFYSYFDNRYNKKYFQSLCKKCESERGKNKYDNLPKDIKIKKNIKAKARKKERRLIEPEFVKQERLYSRLRRVINPKHVLFNNAKARAVRNNIDFDITQDDIFIPEYCPILNIKLKLDNNKISDNSPSLDKIDNNKGYIKGNIKVISNLANAMKRNATKEQLKEFAKNIIKYIEN